MILTAKRRLLGWSNMPDALTRITSIDSRVLGSI